MISVALQSYKIRLSLYDCKSRSDHMAHPSTYRRTAFPNRPWIAGALYDLLASDTVLHCDAYVFTFGGREYLQLEWREGGKDLIALDTWLIEPDGLTSVWDMHRSVGALTYCRNPAIHKRVVVQASAVPDRWARVSLLCHYIDAREIDVEAGLKPSTAYTRRSRKLPDIL